MKLVKFKHWACYVVRSQYEHRPHPWALVLVAATDHGDREITREFVMKGERIAVATVFVEGAQLGLDEVLIKSWSENEGMAAALIDAGVIGPELRRVETGFVEATVHKFFGT